MFTTYLKRNLHDYKLPDKNPFQRPSYNTRYPVKTLMLIMRQQKDPYWKYHRIEQDHKIEEPRE